jgi:hypothetical protein
MMDFVFDEGNLPARMEDHILGGWGRRNQRGARLPVVAHVFRCENGDHARASASRGNVKTEQAGVGIVASQKSRMEQPGDFHVIHKLGLPGQQAWVFVSHNAFSNEFFDHVLISSFQRPI